MVVSIRVFLIFGFGGLLLGGLGVTLFLGFNSATKNTYSLLQDKSISLMNATLIQVDKELQPVERQAKWIVTAFRNKAISLENQEALESFLLGALGTTPHVSAIFIGTPQGVGYRVRQSTRRLDQADITKIEGAMAAVQQAKGYSGPQWEEPLWFDEISNAAINLRTPLIVDNQYIGMLVQIYSVSDLSQTLARNLFSTQRSTPFILYDDDYILVHPLMADKIFPGMDDVPLPAIRGFEDKIIAGFNDIFVYENTKIYSLGDIISGELEIDQKNYFFLYKTIEGYTDKPLTVGAYFEMDAVDGELQILYDSMGIAFGAIIILMLLAIWLTRKISTPVLDIQRSVQAIKRGNYDQVPAIRRGNLIEFNETAEAFNSMVTGLQEKKVISDLFGRVMPAEVAEQMLKSPNGLKPLKTKATVLFSDMAHFTSISEQLQPEEIVELLNAYFSIMTEIIRRHGGIVTQFQGDAILAVFNVPLEDESHAIHAINAAKDMMEAMKETIVAGHSLNCRIGINTGLLVAGNVGAKKRMNYTVHGDAVNLAARLEQLNKEYNTTVLISGSTVAAAGAGDLKRLDSVTVRGKSQPVDIYTFFADGPKV